MRIEFGYNYVVCVEVGSMGWALGICYVVGEIMLTWQKSSSQVYMPVWWSSKNCLSKAQILYWLNEWGCWLGMRLKGTLGDECAYFE